MNVFQALGLMRDHRPDKKVVQLVKHYDDVNKRADEGVLHAKVKFPMYAQVKRDGVFALLLSLNGAVAIFNRTGKRMTNCEKLEEYYESTNLNDGVYFGEMLSRDCSLEQLSGVINPNRVHALEEEHQVAIKNNLYIDFFDQVSIQDFVRGSSDITYYNRWTVLVSKINTRADILNLDVVWDEAQVRAYAQSCTDAGEEGAVFKQDVEWLAGAKDWHQMKIVRGIHVDLECIGYEAGTGKYEGLVANLLFRYKEGRTVKAMLGKGWTHLSASNMFITIASGTPEREQSPCNGWFNPIGKIFHVYGLQESSKGIIRLPKVSELRHDKTEADY